MSEHKKCPNCDSPDSEALNEPLVKNRQCNGCGYMWDDGTRPTPPDIMERVKVAVTEVVCFHEACSDMPVLLAQSLTDAIIEHVATALSDSALAIDRDALEAVDSELKRLQSDIRAIELPYGESWIRRIDNIRIALSYTPTEPKE